MSDGLSFDLRVSYPGFTLSASEVIPGRGITVLSGPSGSGKTTLLRALAGFQTGAEGTVRLGSQDLSHLRPSNRGIGYVFQDARLFPHLDVAGNLDYGARRRGVPSAQVAAIVDALDLSPLLKRDTASLSGGEARRVALGRALASGPRVLLMDEPLAGLDRARKSELMPYIARAVAGFGGPALYVTHSAFEIQTLADRVLSIENGQLRGWGETAPRLIGQITASDGSHIAVQLGNKTVTVPGKGDVGQRCSVPLGEDYLLSEAAPGQGTAAFILAARLVAADDTGAVVEVQGQTLHLPAKLPPEMDKSPGRTLWLTLPRVTGPVLDVQPRPDDSD